MNSFYNRTTELISSLRNTYGLGDVFSHLISGEYLSYWRQADSVSPALGLDIVAREQILNVVRLAKLLPELNQTTREHHEFLIQSTNWVSVYGAFKLPAGTIDYPYRLNVWIDKEGKIQALNMQKEDIEWGRWVRKDLL